MHQIPLFDIGVHGSGESVPGELAPIRRYLHVWNEAERAARIKKPGCEARAKDRSDPVREEADEAACQRITIKGASK